LIFTVATTWVRRRNRLCHGDRATDPATTKVVKSFYGTLTSVMKQATSLVSPGARKKARSGGPGCFQPAAYDTFRSRPVWSKATPDEQKATGLGPSSDSASRLRQPLRQIGGERFSARQRQPRLGVVVATRLTPARQRCGRAQLSHAADDKGTGASSTVFFQRRHQQAATAVRNYTSIVERDGIPALVETSSRKIAPDGAS